MITVDIKRVQQMVQKKITFGHTKCLSKNFRIVVIHRYSIKMFFFSHLHLREILTGVNLVLHQ